MNNEPVAWAREDGVIAFFEKPEVDKQGFKWFPLYTHPAKTLTSQEVMEQTHRNISEAHWKAKTLTDEEIEEVWIQALQDEPKVNAGKFPSLANQPFVFFARAILRKAQEK